MNLKSAKIILCIVINLTVCQYTQSRFTLSLVVSESRNVTYNNSTDAIAFDAYNAGTSTTAMKSPGYPYMAVVRHLDYNGNGTFGDCGGTILSKRWVLTASQCIVTYPRTLRRFLVVFGISDRSVIEYDILRGPGVSMITTNTFVHEEYNGTTHHNDIALLLMPEDIPFSIDIQPIKLTYYSERFVNKNAHLVGWGKDNTANEYTTRLKHVTLPIIENNLCKQYWPHISDKHICTAGGLGKGTCKGDGGGPLIVVQNGQDLQIGITSYGETPCFSRKPDVYTRVSSYIDWIRKVMTLHGANVILNITMTSHLQLRTIIGST